MGNLQENEDSPEALIRHLEERLLKSDVRNFPAQVAELLADDFVEFGASGRMFNRDQVVESLRDEPPAERELTNFRTRDLAPGVVLVTYRVARRGAPGGTPESSLRSSIWKLSDGKWRMLFHQGTPSPHDPPP